MKKLLKSSISVILAVIMVFSVCTVAFAAEEHEPIIVVSGMGCFPLYSVNDAGEEIQVWGPSGDLIKSTVVSALKKFASSKDFLGATLEALYEEMFSYIELNPNGSSVKEVNVPHFDKSVDNYPSDFLQSDRNEDEIGIVKALSKQYGAENVYFFNYDWRLNPIAHATDLNTYINAVKESTGASKVTLIPCSMGGTVVNSYLYKYGHNDVSKIIYTLTASKGLDMVGELFNKSLDVTVDMLVERMFSFEMNNVLLQVLIAAVGQGLNLANLGGSLDSAMAKLIGAVNDRAYNDLLVKTFATLPSIWAFSGNDYYDSNKQSMFGDSINPEFEAMIDEYHYNVYQKAETMMQSAMDDGVDVYVLASYGYVGIPVTKYAWTQSDCLIETKNESFGATCADYGKSLGSDYVALGTVCADTTHNHVSVDGAVDASTCAFPEKTWFIKNNRHVGLDCETDCAGFICWLVETDGADVFTNESYPQFIELNPITGKFSSLTGSKIKGTLPFESIYSKFISVVKSLIVTLTKYIQVIISKVKTA